MEAGAAAKTTPEKCKLASLQSYLHAREHVCAPVLMPANTPKHVHVHMPVHVHVRSRAFTHFVFTDMCVYMSDAHPTTCHALCSHPYT